MTCRRSDIGCGPARAAMVWKWAWGHQMHREGVEHTPKNKGLEALEVDGGLTFGR